MSKLRLLSLVACTTVLLPVVASAHNIIEPDWAGQEGTTFAEWNFTDADNPASPEQADNDYGQAMASIVVGALGEGWLDTLPGVGSQTGLWDLGGDGGSITLDIDNRPYALPYKEIWVQVTYLSDISQAPIVEIAGATLVDGQTVVVEDLGMGASLLDQSIWRIEPNPPHEQVILRSDMMWGSVVDQVVVHIHRARSS